MFEAIAVILVVGVLGVVVFYGLAFPIWMIVHAANSDRFSNVTKGIWIAVILILGVIGAALFAVFATGRRVLRWIGGTGLVLCLVGVVGFFALTSFLRGEFPGQISWTVATLNQAELVELTEQDREEIRVALATLEEEMGQSHLLFGRAVVLYRLYELIEIMLEDRVFTQAEHDEWVRYYESRHLIDGDALEEHVESLRRHR